MLFQGPEPSSGCTYDRRGTSSLRRMLRPGSLGGKENGVEKSNDVGITSAAVMTGVSLGVVDVCEDVESDTIIEAVEDKGILEPGFLAGSPLLLPPRTPPTIPPTIDNTTNTATAAPFFVLQNGCSCEVTTSLSERAGREEIERVPRRRLAGWISGSCKSA